VDGIRIWAEEHISEVQTAQRLYDGGQAARPAPAPATIEVPVAAPVIERPAAEIPPPAPAPASRSFFQKSGT